MTSQSEKWYAPGEGAPACDYMSLCIEEISCERTSLSFPIPVHQHDVYVIAVVLSGGGHHKDESGCLPILAGDVYAVLPGQWHGYPRVHGTLTLCNLAMTRSCLVTCAPLLGDTAWPDLVSMDTDTPPADVSPPVHTRLSPFELGRLYPLLLTLTDEIDDPTSSSGFGVRAGLLLQILGMLGRGGLMALPPDGSASRADEHREEDDDSGPILAAIRYIEQRYMGPIVIEELAEHTGYTPTYLTRKFRQRLGMPPSEYLLNIRIQHACALLRDTRLSIASIASCVGFRDSHYFASRFHQVMGMTPSSFRARSRTDSQTSER